MDKRYASLLTVLIIVPLITVGCTALSGRKAGGSKPMAKGDLYSKVPESMRAPVKEASFDLTQARSNQKLAEKQVVLADLIKEHATQKEKHAGYNKKLADKMVQKREIVVERKRLEAIDNANLGDKSDNIKKIASLRTKELSIESDAVQIKATMDALELEIKKLEKKITRQSQIVANHK